MLLNNSLVHEYIDRVLKDERVSLNDSMISNFVEVFYGKVKNFGMNLQQKNTNYCLLWESNVCKIAHSFFL